MRFSRLVYEALEAAASVPKSAPIGELQRRAVINRLPQLGARAAYFKQSIHERLIEHKQYVSKHGDDLPAIRGWKWGQDGTTAERGTSTEGDNV